jgi:hypothetical protein
VALSCAIPLPPAVSSAAPARELHFRLKKTISLVSLGNLPSLSL